MPQDKEYLLKEQDAAATYQGKLTAGQNIVIDQNNVISALGSTAPPTSVTVTPKTLSGENIADISVNGTTYSLFSSYPRTMTGATTASAGQSGYVPTPSLGSEDYVLYGSGEWKDPHVPVITANPAGSTTTLLNKLYLDGTIYGIAGGGGGSGSTVSITPAFADGVKIADYEIDGTSGMLKIPVKELTQTEYDALPNTKLTDNVVYYISGAKVLDPDYTYHTWGENDEIVVRVYHEGQSDENIVWFFNGWNQTVAYETIPSSLTSYAPDYDAGVILSANYPDGGTVQDGWIGFYQSTIRAWDQGKGNNVTGIKYGVVIVTNGAAEQLNPYEDDPYIWISSSMKKIVVNGTEYGNTGGGGGAEIIPNSQDQPTDTLTSIKINNVTYSIEGGGGGSEDCYLNEGYIGRSGGSYVTCNLDKPMTNGLYCVIADDGGNKISQLFTWAGQTTNVSLIGTLQITETTAGLTSYSGNYRDITASIFKIGSASEIIPNPTGVATEGLTKLEIDGTIYSISGGGGGETTKYYVTDGFLSDGTNRQFITVQLDEALTEGRGYIIAFKNEANGQIIAKSFFDYINDYNVTIGTASSIGNITLNITSTSISSTNYTGSWQDIYIDVYRTSSEGGSIIEANPSEEPTDTLDSIKIDDTVYSIAGSGGTEKVTDIMLPQNNWYFKNEYSMNVAWSNNEIVFTWDGGINIGASAQKSIVIPAETDKIRFKITTGTSYYSTYSALERFKVAVGLRATYDTSWVYPDPTYTSDWLALTSFATPNDVWEGELDTSSIDVDTYLYIMGHGWNMTINEVKTVKIEKNIEPNPEETPTEVLHTLGINSTVYSIPGALQPITLTAAQYEVLPSSEKMDSSKIYFVTDE